MVCDIPNNYYCISCMLCDATIKLHDLNHQYAICQDCKGLIKQLKEERNAKQQRNLSDAESKTSEDR